MRPDILSGEPVFVGTRVLLQNLIDYLAAGDSLEKFLDVFVLRAHTNRLVDIAPLVPARPPTCIL